jgi:hypothetical protein
MKKDNIFAGFIIANIVLLILAVIGIIYYIKISALMEMGVSFWKALFLTVF